MGSGSCLADELAGAIKEDLAKVFEGIFKGDHEGLDFYIHVLSSNPKLYPISGLQHYIGAGFVAARLASFVGLSEYDVAVAFLGGLFHDLNKWAIGEDRAKEYFRGTKIYRKLEGALGSKVEDAVEDAIAIGRSLESGGTPRTLQKVAELVRIGDHLTGGEESWSLSNDVDTLLRLGSALGLGAKNVVPVHVGKRRPVVSLLSDKVLDLLKERGLTPLLSTPEGMLLLAREELTQGTVDSVYDELGRQVVGYVAEGASGASVKIPFGALAGFAKSGRGLSSVNNYFYSISRYTEGDVERAYNDAMGGSEEDRRLFVLALANIYRKGVRAGENEEERLREFLAGVGLAGVQTAGSIERDLSNLSDKLNSLSGAELAEVATKARDFVEHKIRELREEPAPAVGAKLSQYISVGSRVKPVALPKAEGTCSVCREPIVVKYRLTSYLQRLLAFMSGINYSDVFHPDKQGKPDDVNALKYDKKSAKELPVCEVCMFEADALRKHGAVDGLWSYVLTYYPATSIDLLTALRSAVPEVAPVTKAQLTPMPDYMTSRIVIPSRRTDLTYSDLQVAAALWYVFGGGLDVTTVSMSSAYVWSGLPFSVEKGEPVVEEAVDEYMNALRMARRDSRYLKDTAVLRLWLFKLLFEYFRCFGGEGVRPMVPTTGNPTVDAYSACAKQ